MKTGSLDPHPSRVIAAGEWAEWVRRPQGTQLIVGGPGTGKTEFLANRASHLINSSLTASDTVLALSFSRETAADLRERITASTRRSFGELSVGTFYAFARTLVEENSRELVGTSQPPLLLTTPEQIHLVTEMLADEQPQVWPLIYRRMLGTRTLAEELADFMLRCGEQRITPAQLEMRAEGRPAWAALPGFYRRYLKKLESEKKIDYTGLLLRANRALGIERIRAETAARFPYVLVDEYQEATLVQVEILKNLVGAGCHLTAAADPQQTSFSFRGAERASVSTFAETFDQIGGPPAKVLTLKTSHRVPREVLYSAGALFPADPPTLPNPAPHAGRVEFHIFDQEMAENDWIASEIKRLHLTESLPYSKMAVLTRNLAPLASLSRALDRQGVPHTRPGARQIDHPAVRLVLNLAWAAVHDNASDPSPQTRSAVDQIMQGALLGPMFSLTQGRTRELFLIRRDERLTWSETLEINLPHAKGLSLRLSDPSWAQQAPATNGFWKLWSTVPQLHQLVESEKDTHYRPALFSFAQTLGRLAERTPHTSLLDYRRLTLEGDLEASPLLSPQSPAEGQVAVSTVHRAKGRQFEVVFIAGATEGIFPDTRPFRSLLEGQHLSQPDLDFFQLLEVRLEEERNLAYVAMTRAHRRVVWSATAPDLEESRRTVSRFMLQLADRAEQTLSGPAPLPLSHPVGLFEVEGYLRRTQKSPGESLPRRLAASTMLAGPWSAGRWNPLSFAGARSPGSDLGLIDRDHVMSASQADAYQRCPRRYALEHRLRIRPPEESPYLKFGQLMHSVLQTAVERSSQHSRPRLDLLYALELLATQISEVDFGGPVQNEAWRERGEQLLTQLAERVLSEQSQIVGLEQEIDVDLDGISWRGRIDRIDRTENGTLRVVDYKTSKNPMTKKEAAAALQLGFYLWAIHMAEPGGVSSSVSAEFWYPLFAGANWKRSFDPASLSVVVEQLREIAQAIISEKADPRPWPPRPSRECGRCRVRWLCPAWPEGKGAFIS